MNNNNISTIVEQQTITSLEIAEITGRAHKNVLQAIRNMEPAWENVTGLKFQLCKKSYEIGNGAMREIPCYVLNKKETLFVATKFNDEARAKLVLRWEQLEKERVTQMDLHSQEANMHPKHFSENNSSSTLPIDPRNMTRLQILQIALQAEEESERLRAEKEELEMEHHALMIESGEKDQKIETLQKQTDYLRVIMADSSSVTISQIAQDYGQTAVSFNKLLNGLRIQRKVGDQWILYTDFLDKGYVATRMIPIHHAGKPDTFKPVTVWTQAGRKFLYDQLKKHGVLPLMERVQPAQQVVPPTLTGRTTSFQN